MFRSLFLSLGLLCLACNPPVGDDDDDVTGDDDTNGDDDTWPEVEGCRADPKPGDRDRWVVTSLPYDSGAGQADTWTALPLTSGGDLLDAGAPFSMGRATGGELVFTPDAEVGLVAQDDGSLGVVLFPGGDGEPEVVHARFSGEFYASGVVMDPSGERAWVVDGNWVENGGGIYEVSIDCEDGTLTDEGLVEPSKLAADLLLPRGRLDRAILVADDATGSEPGDDAFLLDWPSPDGAMTGADAFGDDEAMVSDAALTSDERYALIGDFSVFSGLPNRVAVVALDGDALAPVQVLDDLEDPVALVPSPFDDAAMVVSGYANALFVLDYAADDDPPFLDAGEPGYDGASPQLPSAAALLARGPLAGTVVVAENQGLRLARFEGDGTVTDLGLLELGDGYEFITGAVGVQP